ncbi:MAG: 30S ribosomal protein S17 [Acidobacteriota bacterium]
MSDQNETQTQDNGRGRQQVLSGVVVSDKQDKTVTVRVERTVIHPLYKRFVKKSKKFAAHDENNECREGDRVVIVSSRPLSKRKRWRVREIVGRAS